jgi:hypothetical protein
MTPSGRHRGGGRVGVEEKGALDGVEEKGALDGCGTAGRRGNPHAQRYEVEP